MHRALGLWCGVRCGAWMPCWAGGGSICGVQVILQRGGFGAWPLSRESSDLGPAKWHSRLQQHVGLALEGLGVSPVWLCPLPDGHEVHWVRAPGCVTSFCPAASSASFLTGERDGFPLQ